MLRRRKFYIIFFIFMLMARISLSGEGTAQLVKEGDRFFKNRGDRHIGDWAPVTNIEHALSSYLNAYDPEDPSPRLVEKIMNASYFYATYAEKDYDKQKKALWKALEIGKETLKRYPDDVGVNYWMGGLWGRWGEVNGIFASARKGVANKVKAYAEKTIMLDPEYADGGGYRTLGRLHFKAPRIPFILSWPSNKEAIRYLSKAVEIGPDNLTNHLFYAEALQKAGLTFEAREHIKFILKAKLNPEKVVEELRDKKEAERLLSEMER